MNGLHHSARCFSVAGELLDLRKTKTFIAGVSAVLMATALRCGKQRSAAIDAHREAPLRTFDVKSGTTNSLLCWRCFIRRACRHAETIFPVVAF